MFRFESPWFLLALLALLIVWLIVYKNKPKVIKYSSALLIDGLPKTLKQRFINAPFYLYVLSFILLVLALARPQWGNQKHEVTTNGIDIALCIDVSTSMYGLDMDANHQKNRLDIVKEVVENFIKKRPTDRMGLVVFAGEAYTQSPMIFDGDMLITFVRQVKVGMTPKDGTAIGLGLMSALARLDKSKAKSKIVLLLTDGENNNMQVEPITAAKAAKQLGVKVYTIAVGRRGRVPYKREFFGRQTIDYFNSNPDFSEMVKIAKITGGKFFKADDKDALDKIYSEIDKLEKTKIDATIYFKWRELFTYPLVCALVCLLMAQLLSATWLRAI